MRHHIQIPLQNCVVMSDIHGRYDLLTTLLEQVKNEETLIFLGDYCDRGRDSFETLYTVKRLVENGQAYAVIGNHDQMFLDFLDEPEEQAFFYFNQGGRETIESFYADQELGFTASMRYTPQRIASDILTQHAELISFLRHLPVTIEMDDFLFVHAGVKPYSPDWKRTTSENDYMWIRQEFYLQKNETGKRVLFGHTSAHHLPEHTTPIWVNRTGNAFGIDGGAGGSGCLNGVRIQRGEIVEIIKALHQGCAMSLPFKIDKKGESKHELF